MFHTIQCNRHFSCHLVNEIREEGLLLVLHEILLCVKCTVGHIMQEQVSVFHGLSVLSSIRYSLSILSHLDDDAVTWFHIEWYFLISTWGNLSIQRMVQLEIQNLRVTPYKL